MAAYAAVVPLHRYFSEVVKRYDVLLPPQVLKTYEFASKELNFFKIFVERLDSRSRKRMNSSFARIMEVIQKYVEDFSPIDFTQAREGFEDFSRGIRSLVEQLKKVVEEYYALPEDDEEEVVSSSSSRVVSKSKMVGLRDQWRLLKDDVFVTSLKSNVHSIVGTAGIGKTTLARVIFEDLDILEWFDCRAWVTAGNDWNSEEITEAILAQVDPEAHKMVMGGSMEKISEGLKETLKGKRYLIVLDDVWHYNVHKYLESLFPDNKNGSQILITTRMKHVGVKASVKYLIVEVRLLDKTESWDLLREKVFVGSSCPPHLEKVGKEIAEKFDGLPLTIITVADLLSEADETLWFDVAKQKKHQIFMDAYDQISKVLYPSYKELLDECKPCFLYMGAFPLKYELPKSRLINLWIAEKFVKPTLGQTSESYAIELLEFLDYNCIIMAYKRGSSGYTLFGVNVKTCGLHSTWWYFCQKEATKTNFFRVLDCYNKESIEEAIEGHCRLSIHNNVLFAIKHVYNSIEEICASTARSLLCFSPYCQYMVPVCFELNFLHRLDALNIRFYDFPLEVLKLVKLRYLALTCNGNLPPSISNLQKLQYLIVHPRLRIKSCGALFHLPMEIWGMTRLKHLQVVGYDLPDAGDTPLQMLITLSEVSIGSCFILHRVPNLMKLGIKIELPPLASDPMPRFDHISHLTKLESLKCAIVNPVWKYEVVSPVAQFPCLLFSLNKLSLSGLGYPWKEMNKITSLPNLKRLKLRYNAFRGPRWEVEENRFPSLLSLVQQKMMSLRILLLVLGKLNIWSLENG